MRLDELELVDFRNYARARLATVPGMNVLIGPNGAGKTNLLEAVAVVCRGRSPRGARHAELVRHGAAAYRVRARVQNRHGQHVLGAAWPPGTARRGADAQGSAARQLPPVRLVTLPLVWFGPDELLLVKGPPVLRRRFLDALTAQLEPAHGAELGEYARVLAQRNSLLRDVRERRTARDLVDLFDQQLLTLGARIVARRLAALAALAPLAAERHGLLGAADGPLGLQYVSGGEPLVALSAADLAARGQAALAALRREELLRGQTLWGPQRDDVRFTLGGREARTFASQGQQRSLVLAIKWAECALLAARLGEPPLLLLDDVLSELDATRAGALVEFVAGAEQVLVATTELPAAWAGRAAAVFRVGGGAVRPAGGGATCPDRPASAR